MKSEETIQKTALATITTLYPDLLISVSMSGINLSGMPIKERAKLIQSLKANYWVNGIPDILIYLPDSKVLNIEFKRESGGVQSEAQKNVQSTLTNLQHNYYLVRSTQEAMKALSSNLDTQYRTACYEAITANLPSTITEQFMFFPTGTELPTIQTTLKDYYGIS